MIPIKKSAVDLTELAVGIVILGIVVSIGATIITNVATSQITNVPVYEVANETVAPTNAGVNLAVSWFKGVNNVYNTSNGIVISSGNYSTTSSGGVGTISNSTCEVGATLSCTNWKVDYSVYNTSDTRFAVPSQAASGLAEYGNWFKILVIVGVAGVIIALLFLAFGGRGREGAAVSY